MLDGRGLLGFSTWGVEGKDIPMCGRFTFQPTEAFYARFQLRNCLDSLMTQYNIAPGQMVPAIIANSPRRIVLMRWGLIPHWAKDAKTAYKMINARIETLTQRPVFRGLLSHNRALVPACGYYEWQGEGRDKTPYYIHPQEDQYIAFAGLYDTWTTPDGEDLYTFTIITTDADPFMAQPHAGYFGQRAGGRLARSTPHEGARRPGFTLA